MNAFRLPVFQRAVALLLFAGASVACVPAASASTGENAAFESELRAALGNSDAVDHALDAARQALSPEAAIDAFIEAYAVATGNTDAAQDIARLLRDHPNRFGAPALPLSHAVWTVASSAPHLVHRATAAVLTQNAGVDGVETAETVGPDDSPAQPTLRTLRTQQPRAP